MQEARVLHANMLRNMGRYLGLCAMLVAFSGCVVHTPAPTGTGNMVREGAEMAPVATRDVQQDVSSPSIAVSENVVVAYLWDVEIQFETPEQGYEICQMLQDMTVLSAGDLSTKRYADYAGRPQQWSVIEMLQTYFVPAVQIPLGRFFMDIEKPEAREVVRQTLADINGYCLPQEQAAPMPQGTW